MAKKKAKPNKEYAISVAEPELSEVCVSVTESVRYLVETAKSDWEKEISDSMSKIDLELSDVYHYIEFSTLNAADGYRAYKLLQEVLRRRRAIKNELALMQTLKAAQKALNEVQKGIERRKTYYPRVRYELFEAKLHG